MNFCGFIEVNVYLIHQLRIFRFSIHSDPLIHKSNVCRLDGLSESNWVLNTPRKKMSSNSADF